MSAVLGPFGRFGIARGIAAWAAVFPMPRVHLGLAGERPHDRPDEPSGRDMSRARSIFARQIKAHGSVIDVLEIGRPGIEHADWFEAECRHQRRDVIEDLRPVDMAAALRSFGDRRFDLVLSIDAIEHVRTPWKVAAEIERILRPGGLTFHTTVFTSRYQPQPEDFFRFTPDGLKSLFDGLECLTAEFDATARTGTPGRRVASADIFGGSREGWRVTYCGRKPGR